MPKRKTEPRACEVSPPLTAAIELPADPRAGWEDDDDKTGSGPVDDLQPIGRVTPVPGGLFDDVDMAKYIDPSLPPGTVSIDGIVYTESDEEPTLLGPNPTIAEDDGDPDYPGVPTAWTVGIDWGKFPAQPARTHCGVPIPGDSAPEAEWKAFHVAVELELKRVEFLDATAIALYGRGFPAVNCYTKAKVLWEQRCKEGIR